MSTERKIVDGCEMVEVEANPGYYRVKYNESKFDSMKLKNSGISLEEAIAAANRHLIICNANVLGSTR
jgi:hypothetical protein